MRAQGLLIGTGIDDGFVCGFGPREQDLSWAASSFAPRIRPTEVRPICTWRAISDLLSRRGAVSGRQEQGYGRGWRAATEKTKAGLEGRALPYRATSAPGALAGGGERKRESSARTRAERRQPVHVCPACDGALAT